MEKGVTKFSRRQAPWQNRRTTLATAMLAAPILFGPACMLGSAFWILVTVPRQYSTWQEMKLVGSSIIDQSRSSTPAKFRWLNITGQATGSTGTDTQRVDRSKPVMLFFLLTTFRARKLPILSNTLHAEYQRSFEINPTLLQTLPELPATRPWYLSTTIRSSAYGHYFSAYIRIWTNTPMKKIVLSK